MTEGFPFCIYVRWVCGCCFPGPWGMLIFWVFRLFLVNISIFKRTWHKRFEKLILLDSLLYWSAFKKHVIYWSNDLQWKELINPAGANVATSTVSALAWKRRMVVKYWPAAAPREENASPFLVKQISRTSVDDYLKRGQRYTIRGITLYTKPTDILEVGFLIRRKAGNAVERNKTRRLFRGLLLNSLLNLSPGRGYLFLFHKACRSTPPTLGTINQLLARYE